MSVKEFSSIKEYSSIRGFLMWLRELSFIKGYWRLWSWTPRPRPRPGGIYGNGRRGGAGICWLDAGSKGSGSGCFPKP